MHDFKEIPTVTWVIYLFILTNKSPVAVTHNLIGREYSKRYQINKWYIFSLACFFQQATNWAMQK